MQDIVRIRYFARLREVAGKDFEDLTLNAADDAGTIYGRLKTTHNFPYERNELRVAINGQFANFELPLKDGDELAFIPPVAGG